MIDLPNVESFVLVAKLGSFRKAADKLNVTQPAISTRIAELESDLGVELFEPSNRRILTRRGRELLSYAERIVELRGLLRFAANEKTAVSGSFRIGVSDTLIHTWFPTLIAKLSERFPLLTLDIQVDLGPIMLDALGSGRLDLALVTETFPSQNLTYAPLCTYPLKWVASSNIDLPRGRTRLTKVAKWPIITHLRHTNAHATVQDLLARDGIVDARVYTSSSVATTLQMVVDGIGIGIVPAVTVEKNNLKERVRILDVLGAPLPSYKFVAAYPRNGENYIAATVARVACSVAATEA